MSSCLSGAQAGTAQKYGNASRCTKSGAGERSRISSVFPSALQPLTSRRYGSAGETSSGERARSNARANERAVTCSPSLKRQPRRIVTV